MAVFHVIDDHVVPEAEYRAKRTEITSFLHARSRGKAEKLVTVAGRELSVAAPMAAAAAPEPIGKGKPLTILIREVYTGEHPHSGLLGDGGDIAVVSAVKNYEVFNASTRALNFMKKDAQKHDRIRRPNPLTDGTSVVSYSPAIMTDSLTIGFELAVANFPQELFSAISTAFTAAAAIPLMLPYSGFLLGAGSVLKLAGNIGHALFDGVKFSVTDSIDFDIWGNEPTAAGFRIISPNDKLAGYSYTDATGLVDANQKKYDGDTPYVVISLDGKNRDDSLKNFAPTVASAAILQRFFDVQSGAQVAIDSIVDGLKLVSDSKYRDRAVSAKNKLAAPNLTDPEKKTLQDEYAAAVKNILNDAMKP